MDTSAGGLLVPEDTIHQQLVLLSLGRYLCWWTISPREYHPPSSQYYYHQVDTSAGKLLVPKDTIHQQSVLLSLGDTSAGGRLVPEDTIHPVVSITITRWIPLLVDDQSQRIPSTQQSVLLSIGGCISWWTISPRGYHPPAVSITITRWIPLLVDYQSQRIPSTSSQYYYHQVDTSAGGLLVQENTIHQQSVLLSLGGYLCWWTISPRGYHPPVVSITITRWIPLLVDYQLQRISFTQQSVLLSLGG